MSENQEKTENGKKTKEFEIKEPADWSWEAALSHLIASLCGRGIPEKRVHFQVERDSQVLALGQGWDPVSDRQAAWQELVQAGRKAISEILPVCVQCGQCCRNTSPTLHLDDLELITADRIQPGQLRTLRAGEPVHSPFDGRLFYLNEERIKLREKPGGSTCLFLDEQSDQCTIWPDRPVQCRAQACWDPEPAREVLKQPVLNRRHILGGLDSLVQLLDEHDRRCSHEQLRKVFEDLKTSQGEAVEPVLEAIAFEDHFRGFVAEQFNLPAGSMDFFFGRSFVSMLRLFGFKVEEGADGTRTLLPDSDQARS
jgi:Fe-S-cluster containining protein